MLSKCFNDKQKQMYFTPKKYRKTLQCCIVRKDPFFVPSQQVLKHTSIDIQTNSSSTCHTLSYPSKDARGFPYFSCCADNACYKIFFSQYRFHKPLTSCSPTKRNLGRSGEHAGQAVDTPTYPTSALCSSQTAMYCIPKVRRCPVMLKLHAASDVQRNRMK